ncbi:MAG: hypothetical protein IID40_10920 [Planctomycetes bacterium]|nr:hypothetical protein [Planctomycetota bacterium]
MHSNPRPADRDYFRTALALARMRQSQYEAATQVLAEVDTPTLRVRTSYLRLHVAGELHRYDEAREAYGNLTREASSVVQELQDELRRRYIDRKGPEHSDDWCFDRHIAAFLLAA